VCKSKNAALALDRQHGNQWWQCARDEVSEWWPCGVAGSALHVQDTMGLVECGVPLWAEPLDIIR
jgi:hypothetical protein